MKNKLLKIRNEMSKNDQDIGYSKILKKTEKKKGLENKIIKLKPIQILVINYAN